MKNRYAGLLTVTFPDGYKEKCLIITRQTKGETHYLSEVKEALTQILKTIPEGHIKIRYKGDFQKRIFNALGKTGVDLAPGWSQN